MTGQDPFDFRADDLRYLVAVADSGRVVSAAKALGVDHSTVSRRLQALERSLGVRLLDRGPDGWNLTDKGQEVLEHARTVVKAMSTVAQVASGSGSTSLSGTVRVTAADGFGAVFVVPALARVREQHPSLNVELVTGARELTLRESSFDLAVTVGVPTTRLFNERLCEYDNAFFASDEYLARHGDPTSLAELSHHPLVFFVDAMERIHELDVAEHVPEPNVRFSSNNIFAMLEAVRLGVGVGLLSKFMAERVPGLRPVAAYVPPARVPVTLVARRESVRRREVLVVREALQQEVRDRRHELIWTRGTKDDASRTT
ncbi:LysR family transcriptional regulator [Kineococcus rhizosphaerae]|uniref:DNA-binding transcriptional LysR family regulator n=1 Tax=Kineococcus rhizosphaerae TaxID=559628 RepID=A0A2T0QWK2_9ACTN|nr:LysR family transcriptional regulator [Kineococcus rhizosphaerae]PRY09764.1 DNA-binding transcriptional LysR family regulator [Kineococcus rhizosphaerae]